LLDSPYDSDIEANLITSTEEDLLNTTYNVNVQESDTVELPESFVRKRKKRGKPQDWNKNFQKTKRLEGKEYFGKKKIDGVWKYNVHKAAKSLKTPCNCILQTKTNCILNCKEVTETQRKNIFKSFWAIINEEARIQFLKNNMKILPTARKRGLCSTKRNSSVQYYLNNIRVCKTMFLNTLDIGENMIKKIINESHTETEISGEDNTEDNNLESTPTSTIHQSISDRKLLLNTFFDLLPKLESHYCRASTSKLYLEPVWLTKTSLYNFYCNDFCVSHNTTPMSNAMFYITLDEKNISLFKPKKDACDLCTAYATGNLSIDQKQLHDQMKFEARQEKETDKESENEVFTMDLQSVLLCPKSNVSSQYYKTKLIVHNFTVYDLKRKNGYCFLWNETEGGLTAHEFSSIIVHFLQKFVIDNAKVQNANIILYSDGCTYQNRNATLSNALLNLSLLSGITIIQKYLLRGHTQMEVDSMHSTIERKIRHKKINIPADYVTACKTACIKNPYYVEYLSFNFFKSFSKIMFFKSIRPGNKKGDPVVTEIKALMYEANKEVSYKLRFSEDWSNLLLSRNSSSQTPISIETLPPLHTHRINIKKEKYEHLQQLKESMEKDYHSFYDNLPKA